MNDHMPQADTSCYVTRIVFQSPLNCLYGHTQYFLYKTCRCTLYSKQYRKHQNVHSVVLYYTTNGWFCIYRTSVIPPSYNIGRYLIKHYLCRRLSAQNHHDDYQLYYRMQRYSRRQVMVVKGRYIHVRAHRYATDVHFRASIIP